MDINTQSPSATELLPEENHRTLDLSDFPPVYVVPTHFRGDEKQELVDILRRHRACVTLDPSEAKVFIGKVGTKKRAEFELRNRKLKVEEIFEAKRAVSPLKDASIPCKRRKTGTANEPIAINDEDSITEEEGFGDSGTKDEPHYDKFDTLVGPSARSEKATFATLFQYDGADDIIWFIKTDWLSRCIEASRLLPLEGELVYKGKVIQRPLTHKPAKSIAPSFASPTETTPTSHLIVAECPRTSQGIIDRAQSDAKYIPHRRDGHGSQRFEGKSYTSGTQRSSHNPRRTAHLLQQTTSEYESEDSDLPPAPDWVKKGIRYSCQRFTPADAPNEEFLSLLKKIRTARTLMGDEVGVRAYSTIIASVAAYPYALRHPRELLRLPGCETRAADLFTEWKNTGQLRAVADLETDETMQTIHLFHGIWGVGPKTARLFHLTNHWRDLDDIVEFGWDSLDRVQQIGLKYYDDFLAPIPRAEVERIAATVREHAVRLRDDGISVTLVGGHRRGKPASGDVDLIVSHPDLAATAGLVQELVQALEDAGLITHTLTLSLHNTHRGQSPLAFRGAKPAGTGFDTLDKALVVWQDAGRPRRRVDIIVSPWRTVGCAVMGWSGETTFQRDLRRYAKARGLKFDSSGVRSRETGEVVWLEGERGVEGSAEEAERRVFEGLGLEFVPPEMRCTG